VPIKKLLCLINMMGCGESRVAFAFGLCEIVTFKLQFLNRFWFRGSESKGGISNFQITKDFYQVLSKYASKQALGSRGPKSLQKITNRLGNLEKNPTRTPPNIFPSLQIYRIRGHITPKPLESHQKNPITLKAIFSCNPIVQVKLSWWI
jgi:hypothetical protein